MFSSSIDEFNKTQQNMCRTYMAPISTFLSRRQLSKHLWFRSSVRSLVWFTESGCGSFLRTHPSLSTPFKSHVGNTPCPVHEPVHPEEDVGQRNHYTRWWWKVKTPEASSGFICDRDQRGSLTRHYGHQGPRLAPLSPHTLPSRNYITQHLAIFVQGTRQAEDAVDGENIGT